MEDARRGAGIAFPRRSTRVARRERARKQKRKHFLLTVYVLGILALFCAIAVRADLTREGALSSRSVEEEDNYSAVDDSGAASFSGEEDTTSMVRTSTPVVNTTALVFHDIAPLHLRAEDFVWEGDRLKYTGSEYDVRFGIDISSYQTEDRRNRQIDWEAARADGVDFAIIRVAIRGTSEGALWLDTYYSQNIDGAMAAGIQTGVYVFSQAVTVEEALDEAELVIACLREHPIDGPVCYDWEVENRTYRTYRVSGETATACALAFCQRIEEEGYTPMIYTSQEIADLKYDWDALSSYRLWYPWYVSKRDKMSDADFYHHMVIWQFSKRCEVDGVGKKVDANLWFRPKS